MSTTLTIKGHTDSASCRQETLNLPANSNLDEKLKITRRKMMNRTEIRELGGPIQHLLELKAYDINADGETGIMILHDNVPLCNDLMSTNMMPITSFLGYSLPVEYEASLVDIVLDTPYCGVMLCAFVCTTQLARWPSTASAMIDMTGTLPVLFAYDGLVYMTSFPIAFSLVDEILSYKDCHVLDGLARCWKQPKTATRKEISGECINAAIKPKPNFDHCAAKVGLDLFLPGVVLKVQPTVGWHFDNISKLFNANGFCMTLTRTSKLFYDSEVTYKGRSLWCPVMIDMCNSQNLAELFDVFSCFVPCTSLVVMMTTDKLPVYVEGTRVMISPFSYFETTFAGRSGLPNTAPYRYGEYIYQGCDAQECAQRALDVVCSCEKIAQKEQYAKYGDPRINELKDRFGGLGGEWICLAKSSDWLCKLIAPGASAESILKRATAGFELAKLSFAADPVGSSPIWSDRWIGRAMPSHTLEITPLQFRDFSALYKEVTTRQFFTVAAPFAAIDQTIKNAMSFVSKVVQLQRPNFNFERVDTFVRYLNCAHRCEMPSCMEGERTLLAHDLLTFERQVFSCAQDKGFCTLDYAKSKVMISAQLFDMIVSECGHHRNIAEVRSVVNALGSVHNRKFAHVPTDLRFAGTVLSNTCALATAFLTYSGSLENPSPDFWQGPDRT